jgi:uncharacterized protein YbaP (TraB family)
MKLVQRLATLALVLASTLLAAAPAHADPALWVVKGPHSTVYLFGSVHVLQKDKPWRAPKIDAALHDSNDLWLEIPDVDDPSAMQPLILQLGVDREHPLSTLLTKDQLAHLDTTLKSFGIVAGEPAFEPMRPWLVAMTLSVLPIVKAGFDPGSGVEVTLKPEFVKAGKPVHGFETSEQQMHFLADMPQKEQIDYLNQTVDWLGPDGHTGEAVAAFNKLVDAWYAGDTANIEHFGVDEMRKTPNLYRLLIAKRNQGFATQIDGLLKGTGTSFVAIGAAHLVGPDGVAALLEKQGWKVERE